MNSCLFSGSFDPITLGHLEIIENARKVFSHVHVVIFQSVHKKGLFTVEERIEIAKESLKDISGVSVDESSGLVVEYMKKHNISKVVRGLRNIQDFEYEKDMERINKGIYEKYQSVYFISKSEFSHISSTVLKELLYYGKDISQYTNCPKLVEKIYKKK